MAVQQTDITPLAGDNAPSNITTAATLAEIEKQVQQDQIDLPAAIAGNQAATTVSDQGVKIAEAILAAEPSVVAAEQAEVKTNAASANTNAASSNANAASTKSGKPAKSAKSPKTPKRSESEADGNESKRSMRAHPHARQFQRGRRYVSPGAVFDETAGN